MFVSLAALNENGTARREFGRDGREYLVAPVTMLVPGVLPGSKGALYYPPDEVARNVDAWEGAPLTVGHPQYAGQPVSATHASVRPIGRVRAPAIRNGSLRAEAWFDVAAVRYESPALLQRLERGTPVEVSTGLYTDNEPAQPGARHNGRRYEYVARNYRPDHLAILPDATGACSLSDGCGVYNQVVDEEFARVSAYCHYILNTKSETAMNVLSTDRERRDVMPTLNCECVSAMPLRVLSDNSLSQNERRNVMPVFGLDDVFTADERDAAIREENVRRLGLAQDHYDGTGRDTRQDPTATVLNEDALNAVLFGSHWANG